MTAPIVAAATAGVIAPSRRNQVAALAVVLAPVALVVVAEAAWISVFAGLLQEFALRDPILGIPGLVVFVVAGVVLARLLGPRLGKRWPAVAFALVLGSGAVGWLLSPAARSALGDGLGPALAAHPAGWLAGLAMLRGFPHARVPLAEDTVTNLLVIGIPSLAFAATLGGLVGDPYRARFLADSLGAAVVYVAAAVLARAFARLDAIGVDAGFDWRRNPPWLLLTIAMMAVAIAVAVPLASVAGTIISVVFSLALGPMLVVGIATGFDRVIRRLFGFFLIVLLLLLVVIRLFGHAQEPLAQTGGGGTDVSPSSTAEQLVTISLGSLVLLGVVVTILVLVALWMRRAPAPDGVVGETRTIDPGGDDIAPRRRRNRFGFRGAPTTAVQAYVALVDDLERHPDVRREPAETPAAHAARLRSAGRSGLSLDLLAADYALARYGGVDLAATEDRRAVGRWRSLRRRLTIQPDGATGPDGRGATPGSATAPDAELPLDLEPRRPF